KQLRSCWSTSAVNVNDVQRRTSNRRCRNNFFQRLNAARGFFHTSVPQVDVTGCAVTRRDAKHLEDLPARRIRYVLNSESDSDCTTLQTLFETLLHLLDLSICCGSARGVACWQKLQRLVHRCHARGQVSGTHPVIDQRLLFALRIPAVDVPGADFEFESSGHSVHRFEAIVFFVLSMLVQVDESG